MARQYQTLGGAYVNDDGNGREYQTPGGAYINEEQAAAPASIVGPLVHSRLAGLSPLIGGRLSA